MENLPYILNDLLSKLSCNEGYCFEMNSPICCFECLFQSNIGGSLAENLPERSVLLPVFSGVSSSKTRLNSVICIASLLKTSIILNKRSILGEVTSSLRTLSTFIRRFSRSFLLRKPSKSASAMRNASSAFNSICQISLLETASLLVEYY